MTTVAATTSYLKWVATETSTSWWHDSGVPQELTHALQHGATGVTTNPVLTSQAIRSDPSFWRDRLRAIPDSLTPRERAGAIIQIVVTHAAKMLEPVFHQTGETEGYVCAQLDPSLAADCEAMIEMARRFSRWAPNIAVKFPVTAAGLEAMEECAAEGITATATVSFTVPQVLAVAERYRAGRRRAEQTGRTPGQCFAVIMIGRLDDYLRDVARDRQAHVTESDLRQAGLAVTKRAYAIYQERGYDATLLVAALRGTYHMEDLVGAKLIMSIHPSYQEILQEGEFERRDRIDDPIDPRAIERLTTVPEFVRAYEPDGMTPHDFITYGVSQRTLAQFSFAGWSLLEALEVSADRGQDSTA